MLLVPFAPLPEGTGFLGTIWDWIGVRSIG
jgi:hypothetical protein